MLSLMANVLQPQCCVALSRPKGESNPRPSASA